MRHVFALCVLTLISSSLFAANVYVMDAGFNNQFYSQIKNRFINETCHSLYGGDKRRVQDNTFSGGRFYEYKQASLCTNELGLMYGNGAAMVRTGNLPGHRGGQTGDRDVDTQFSGRLRYHHYMVGNVITQNTSSSVRQWHSHPRILLGRNGGQEWTRYNEIRSSLGTDELLNGLNYLASNANLAKGIEVVNLSIGAGSMLFSTPCDLNTEVVNEPQLLRWKNIIESLRNKGITVVASSGNTGATRKMGFPACLSTTIAVGGVDSSGKIYGDISPHTDFLHSATTQHPIFQRIETGTSFAAPRVVAQLAELRTINPTRTMNQVLNTTRSTADLYCGSREEGNLTHRFCIQYPNFQKAYNSLVDSFWSEHLYIPRGVSINQALGWNYGTSKHKNGVISSFDTIEFSQSNQSNKSQAGKTISSKLNVGEPAIRYSFRAYDIDTNDEVELLVNGNSYGYIDITGENQLGEEQVYCINPSEQQTNGDRNEVTLRLKSSGETWGVTQLKVQAGEVDASCKQADPVDPPQESNETVQLELGVVDTKKYGRNYGRNKNTSKLDAVFTPTAGRNHTLSWQVYDIETGEMGVYLNDSKIKDIPRTFNNSLGAIDSITIPALNLKQGENTLSFKISGGDELWGVTNLQAKSLLNPEDGQPGSLVLLDNPDKFGYVFGGNSHTNSFNFSFTPRGKYYDEVVKISFKGFVSHGGENGFEALLNGRRILYIPSYIGRSEYKNYSVVLNKNAVRNGSNTLTIRPTKTHIFYAREFGVTGIKVVAESTPLQDLTATSTSFESRFFAHKPLNVFVRVDNEGVKNSLSDTLSLYVGSNENMNDATLVAELPLSTIQAGGYQTVSHTFSSRLIPNKKYLRACVKGNSSDAISSNNCTAPVQVNYDKVNISPILFLLLNE